MAHDDRDKRGGHIHTEKDMYACGCCPVLTKKTRSRNRTRRDRADAQYQRRAEEGNRS